MSQSSGQRKQKVRKPFYFKQFEIYQERCAMKVSTDGIVLGAWVSKTQTVKESPPQTVLDLGTGTGLLSLIMAQSFPKAQITALELDPAACEQAKENFTASPWGERLEAHEADINTYVAPPFDLLICNPPYFIQGLQSSDPSRTLARHTVALTHESLIKQAFKLLKPSGSFAWIMPLYEGQLLLEKAIAHGFHPEHITEVRHHQSKPIKRLLVSLKKQPCLLNKNLLTLKNESGYSSEFKSLTGDFYVIFD